MSLGDVDKVLVVADQTAARTPMRFPAFANAIQGLYPQQVGGCRKLFTT